MIHGCNVKDAPNASILGKVTSTDLNRNRIRLYLAMIFVFLKYAKMVFACIKQITLHLDALIATAKGRLGWIPSASETVGKLSKVSQKLHSVVALKITNLGGNILDKVTS